MTDFAHSASRPIATASARVKDNRRRLAAASVATLVVLTLTWALREESRLPDTQKSELFAVLAQAYP
jgi:hypothetical protein